MLMLSIRTIVVAALAVLAASPAEAGLFRHRCRSKVVVRQVWRGCGPAAAPCQPVGWAPPTFAPSPQAAPQAPAKTYPAPGPVGYAPLSLDQQAAVAVTTTAIQAGDAYGFGAWLNSVRAGYGLAPVGHDPNLDGWAAANSADMARANRLRHAVMGAARRQNSGWGHYSQMGAMWLASPPHRAALLDPTIRFYGLAGLGAWWTFSAN